MLFCRSHSNFPPLTIATVALLALCLAPPSAEAGRAHSKAPNVSVLSNSAGATKQVDRSGSGIDAEKIFQEGPAQVAVAANSTEDAETAALTPLPASVDLDSDLTGELRGKSLVRVMSVLPRVGADSSPETLLEFWDDASSARSALDDRATAAGDLSSAAAVPGVARGAGQSNVMIPLPSAVLSGSSLLGGLGLLAGLRRMIRR